MSAAGAALLLAFACALLAPSVASAGTPAICEEYPDLPECDEAPGGGGGGGDDVEDEDDRGEAPGGGGGGAGPSGDADGALPFTGYPMTPLLLLLLALLVAGLTLRTYLTLRERARGRSAPSGLYE